MTPFRAVAAACRAGAFPRSRRAGMLTRTGKQIGRHRSRGSDVAAAAARPSRCRPSRAGTAGSGRVCRTGVRCRTGLPVLAVLSRKAPSTPGCIAAEHNAFAAGMHVRFRRRRRDRPFRCRAAASALVRRRHAPDSRPFPHRCPGIRRPGARMPLADAPGMPRDALVIRRPGPAAAKPSAHSAVDPRPVGLQDASRIVRDRLSCAAAKCGMRRPGFRGWFWRWGA